MANDATAEHGGGSGVLDGSVAVVTGVDTVLGAGLAAAILGAGAEVKGMPNATPLGTRAEVDAAFASVGSPWDVLIHAAIPEGAALPRAFAEVDDTAFAVAWESVMQCTLWCFQAAYESMRGRGGRIIVPMPTFSMTGAAGLVPYAMGVEGQRILCKSAARQWGADGITVNCIATAPEHVLAAGFGAVGCGGGSLSLAPAALGGVGDPATDLGPIVVFLASQASHFVTGTTLCCDGGTWLGT